MYNTYKRKTDRGVSNKDPEVLISALKAIKIENQGLLTVAKSTGIARTSLRRYVQQFDATGKNIAEMDNAQLKIFVQSLPTYGSHQLVR